jgi:hypothetical protein
LNSYNLLKTDWLFNCCWASPAQWFLVPNPTGLMTIFYTSVFMSPCDGVTHLFFKNAVLT